MSAIAHFGRSATVPATMTGADVAPAVTTLREVSITGAEYPNLYRVTGHIVAEMLARRASEHDRGAHMAVAFYMPQVTRAPWIVKNTDEALSEIEGAAERGETGEPWITYQVFDRPFRLGDAIDTSLSTFWAGSHFLPDHVHQALTSSCTWLHVDPFVYEDTALKLLWAEASVELEVQGADVYVEHVGPEPQGVDVLVEDVSSPEAQSLVELAEEVGAIPAEVTPRVELSGNLTRDVLALTGFTAAELATVVGRTERSVRQWSADDHVPDSMASLLQQLRTIALRLVGGLGPGGVRAWLLSGEPSPAQLIAAGRAQELLAETERLLDSPAT